MLNINDLIHGDPDDPATRLEGAEESHCDTSSDDHDSPPSNHMEITDPNNMFAALPSYDVNMTDQSSAPGAEKNVEQICSDLQSKLMLDPEHLEIALIGSKASPEARHASLVFTNGAYHQLGNKGTQKPSFVYDDTFRDFVRTSAWMFLLKPTLEAYSNNPHQNTDIPKTLFYLTLDAVEKQPDAWKDDHLPPRGVRANLEVLNHYRKVVGELLKYQRSNLRTLEMLTMIYKDLPPKLSKLTEKEIKHQVHTNFAMRARMCYARLVMVYYYIHKSKKESQWIEIDERLDLVLEKDSELFSDKKEFASVQHQDLTVPTIEDVRIALAGAHSSGVND
ncbi:hypothetical protein PGT21_030117 [Puccinia graminis f. sp. tritici]|uniref:Uncharacterized protein n=1 Tax=Puccinia graminis f. sp. tritici TaxID=56615 RepID=A0A5B0NFQ2_PUCGR|nr:hypothetical protein PGT21_030117 [Puccinia graminis f. sp. tritici]